MSCPLQRTALSSVTGNIPAEGDANAFPPHILAYASLKEAGYDKLKVVQIIGFSSGQILIMEVGLFCPP